MIEFSINDIFFKGITPKVGKYSGKRFRVSSILKDSVTASLWDSTDEKAATFHHGTYKLWEKPSNVLVNAKEKLTVGSLCRAIKDFELTSDTEIRISDDFGVYPAMALLTEVTDRSDDETKTMIVIFEK